MGAADGGMVACNGGGHCIHVPPTERSAGAGVGVENGAACGGAQRVDGWMDGWEEVSWEEVAGKRCSRARGLLDCQKSMAVLFVLAVVLEPLRHLTSWFLNVWSCKHRLSEAASARQPC